MEINLHDARLIALVIHICAVRAIAHLHFGHKNAVAIFLVLELEAGGGVEKNIVFAYIFYANIYTSLCKIRIFLQIIHAFVVEHFESVMRLENFIFFVANLVIRNKVDLIINLVKKSVTFLTVSGVK